MKLRYILLLGLVTLGFYLFLNTEKNPKDDISSIQNETPADTPVISEIEAATKPKAITSTEPKPLPPNSVSQPMAIVEPSPSKNPSDAANRRTIPKFVEFKIDPDGWAVAYGDVLLGIPQAGVNIKVGMAQPHPLNLWDTTEIPFHIPKDFPNPERILEAFEYFKDTSITFVPYQGQSDAIVFEAKKGHCRSYLGKIGGLQPILLANECQAKEIAHELMHALGFIHEHSRIDRDEYVDVIWNNIDEQFQSQFTMVPESLMEPLRDFPFDYESIMIYPPKAFAKQADLPTLTSKNETPIVPTKGLSKQDIERVNKLYVR